MEYLLMAVIVTAFFVGLKLGKKSNKADIPIEEMQRAERLKKEFGELMNYNLTKALERKP